MSEFEKRRASVTNQVKSLCAHCSNGVPHQCRVQRIAQEIERLRGVPLMVNDHFSGLLLSDIV